MAKTTLYCIDPDGNPLKRTTRREYKFVLVGRKDVVKLREAEQEFAQKSAKMDFKYYQRIADGQQTCDRYTAEQARELIGGIGATRDDYAKLILARKLAFLDKKYGEGATAGRWEAIAWSTRRELVAGRKATEAQEKCYRDLQIMPVFTEA